MVVSKTKKNREIDFTEKMAISACYILSVAMLVWQYNDNITCIRKRIEMKDFITHLIFSVKSIPYFS